MARQALANNAHSRTRQCLHYRDIVSRAAASVSTVRVRVVAPRRRGGEVDKPRCTGPTWSWHAKWRALRSLSTCVATDEPPCACSGGNIRQSIDDLANAEDVVGMSCSPMTSRLQQSSWEALQR